MSHSEKHSNGVCLNMFFSSAIVLFVNYNLNNKYFQRVSLQLCFAYPKQKVPIETFNISHIEAVSVPRVVLSGLLA